MDDSPASPACLAKELESLDYHVTRCTSVPQALSLAALTPPPDVCLLEASLLIRPAHSSPSGSATKTFSSGGAAESGGFPTSTTTTTTTTTIDPHLGVLPISKTLLDTLPTVLVSHIDHPALVLATVRLGAVDFIRRPVPTAKLRTLWQHKIRRHKTHGASRGRASSSRAGVVGVHAVGEKMKGRGRGRGDADLDLDLDLPGTTTTGGPRTRGGARRGAGGGGADDMDIMIPLHASSKSTLKPNHHNNFSSHLNLNLHHIHQHIHHHLTAATTTTTTTTAATSITHPLSPAAVSLVDILLSKPSGSSQGTMPSLPAAGGDPRPNRASSHEGDTVGHGVTVQVPVPVATTTNNNNNKNVKNQNQNQNQVVVSSSVPRSQHAQHGGPVAQPWASVSGREAHVLHAHHPHPHPHPHLHGDDMGTTSTFAERVLVGRGQREGAATRSHHNSVREDLPPPIPGGEDIDALLGMVDGHGMGNGTENRGMGMGMGMGMEGNWLDDDRAGMMMGSDGGGAWSPGGHVRLRWPRSAPPAVDFGAIKAQFERELGAFQRVGGGEGGDTTGGSGAQRRGGKRRRWGTTETTTTTTTTMNNNMMTPAGKWGPSGTGEEGGTGGMGGGEGVPGFERGCRPPLGLKLSATSIDMIAHCVNSYGASDTYGAIYAHGS